MGGRAGVRRGEAEGRKRLMEGREMWDGNSRRDKEHARRWT